MSLKKYFENSLKGISQVMLQENIYTGALFIIGVIYYSISMAFGMILSTFVATYFATKMSFDNVALNSGIYGFNSALVGVATTLFFGINIFSIILIFFGAILTVILQEFFRIKKMPVFTLPFVLVTWLFLWIFSSYIKIGTDIVIEDESLNLLSTVFKGFSEVFFQDSIITGIIFFIAIFISSKKAAFFSLIFGIISSFLAYVSGFSNYEINMGFFAYNAVLGSIVISNFRNKPYLWAFITVVLSLFIQIFFIKYNFIALTFPFVLASFLLVIVNNKLSNKEKL